MQRALFITGTDTSVGKTVLTALLVKHLRAGGVNAAALKPVCSGGRADARALRAAMDGALSLDEINPWHFHAPLAPSLAARRERKTVTLARVSAFVQAAQRRWKALLLEGAGGLLSPLGTNFNSRDLMLALRVTPLIVAPNRLGVVNQLLLTLDALPKNLRRRAKVILMAPPGMDAAAASNAKLLAEFFDAKRIFMLPWLGENLSVGTALRNPRVHRTLEALVETE